MKKIKIFQVDAFAEKLFAGNAAAVVIVEEKLTDSLMQKIANENNLAETVFIKKEVGQYSIVWFSPEAEVDLCGHATLAAAYVLFNYYDKEANLLKFKSRKRGVLSVSKNDNILTLDFPTDNLLVADLPAGLDAALGARVLECYKGTTDYMVLLENEDKIRDLKPDFLTLRSIDCRGVIVTAKGKTCDFVSRFFAPQIGIPEDPVTGSAHTMLIPYWSKKLNKTVMNAKQLSSRGGELHCEYLGERVKIGGKAVLYLSGEIEI